MIHIDNVATIPGMDGWLLIDFTNGSKKFVDIKPHMEGILKKLKDPEFFSKVYVDDELRTITWPGELDLDPDQLHREGIDLIESKKIIEVRKIQIYWKELEDKVRVNSPGFFCFLFQKIISSSGCPISLLLPI
jgi:hypothetical protein